MIGIPKSGEHVRSELVNLLDIIFSSGSNVSIVIPEKKLDSPRFRAGTGVPTIHNMLKLLQEEPPMVALFTSILKNE